MDPASSAAGESLSEGEISASTEGQNAMSPVPSGAVAFGMGRHLSGRKMASSATASGVSLVVNPKRELQP